MSADGWDIDLRGVVRAGMQAPEHLRLSALGSLLRDGHRGRVHIDRYEFGALVVDGREIHTDVLINPRGVQERWWRREGHVLRLDDLDAVMDNSVERLVIGTGAYGRMRPVADLERSLAARGVSVEVLPTAAAADRINELLRVGAVGWAGALHLTCLGLRSRSAAFAAAGMERVGRVRRAFEAKAAGKGCSCWFLMRWQAGKTPGCG